MRIIPALAFVAAHLSAHAASPSLIASSFPAPNEPGAIAHSHNDFAQRRPLDLALENGFRSIEVDVTDRWGEVRVTHLGFFTDGSLKEMYLDRLQKLVDEKGSVHGDGKRFYIWIEVRPYVSSDGIVPMLQELLPKYPMLAQFGEDGREVKAGPVEAILINSSRIVSKFFESSAPKPACRGISGIPSKRAKHARFARWAYMMWDSAFNWRGGGEMPEDEIDALREIQDGAHALGLRTRFWAAPDEDLFWRQAVHLPFDLVGTDRLDATMKAIRAASEERSADRKLASTPEKKKSR
jgi:hypothetical protein